MKVAEMLLLWMKINDVSLRQLAKRVEVDQSVIFRFLHNKPISQSNFIRLLKWLLSEGQA